MHLSGMVLEVRPVFELGGLLVAAHSLSVSLANVVARFNAKREELGVEIYAGYDGSEVLHHDYGSMKGVATNDVRIFKGARCENWF